MKTTTAKVEEIIPAEYNPRETLRPGEAEYDALKNSVEKFGLASPLIVNERTGRLVSGHQRLNVLKEMGQEEAEVVLVDLDEEHEKGLNLALNKIDGFWDYEKLEAVLNEMEKDDLELTGFSEEELENLLDKKADPEALDDSINAAEAGGAAAKEGTFNVYLSFPGKDQAEAWLEEREIKAEYRSGSRSVSIRMEGSEYGSQGN